MVPGPGAKPAIPTCDLANPGTPTQIAAPAVLNQDIALLGTPAGNAAVSDI